MRAGAAPGAGLTHPLTLAALASLLFNDHVLKHGWPGMVSGKLSDFAGVLLLPLFLHALLELGFAKVARRSLSPVQSDRALVLLVVVSSLAFALPEIWPVAESAYRYGLGAARWPFRAGFALLAGERVPEVAPVRATADVSDLLALPMALVALRIGRRRAGGLRHRERRAFRTALPAALVLLAGLVWSEPADAAKKLPYHRDGFYLALELGLGGGWLSSTGTVNNGFMQELPSSARALMAPASSLELGGTLAQYGLVLGGRVAVAAGREPVIETAGERFKVRGQSLILIELTGIAEYYPDLRRGLHFGAGFGGAALGVNDSSDGAPLGFSGSLEAGHAFFITEQWSLGATLRLTLAQTYAQENADVASTFFMPALLLSVSRH